VELGFGVQNVGEDDGQLGFGGHFFGLLSTPIDE
jgi:hypothetical protein